MIFLQLEAGMKNKYHSYEPHLAIRDLSILPGQEWSLKAPEWSMMLVRDGNGYCLRHQKSEALEVDMALLIGGQSAGVLRASQLGKMSLQTFNVIPDRLTGLITLGEHDLLKTAAARNTSAIKVFPVDHPLAIKLKELCNSQKPRSVAFRLELLQLFVEAVGDELANVAPAADHTDARERLRLLLEQTLPDQLAEMNFRDLARRTHCTSRHLSRIFQDLVGMSFRDKRVEIRMARARELLATSKSKVVEVALESGFKSLSLFNLMFTRRFGTSPGRWRRRNFKHPAVPANGKAKKPRRANFEAAAV
jgi:AraC-like DNA-binding protein